MQPCMHDQPREHACVRKADECAHVAVRPLQARLRLLREALQQAESAEADHATRRSKAAQDQRRQAKPGVHAGVVRLAVQHLHGARRV